MSYSTVAQLVVNYARTAGNGRICSLDLETRVLGRDLFLTGERILAASLAWREEGSVRTRVCVLEQETEAAEWKLLDELDGLLLSLRPLVLVGYYITCYDVPLLSIKMRKTPKPFWGIQDTISRAFVLDLKDPVRFDLAEHDGCSPRARTFDSVILHPRFGQLPLIRAKGLAEGRDRQERGEAIYNLWKNDQEHFRLYSQGDSHDALLIFEELFLAPHANKAGAIPC